MAQENNYSKVDLRVGTEAQFNAKVDTLPAGTLFGVTDATVSKADLSTDLKNEINEKINKPANPTEDSIVSISSTGAVSAKSFEVYVGQDLPTGNNVRIWIDPTENDPTVEYGIKWTVGASSPIGTRVKRIGGEISTWDITYTPNVGSVNYNAFDSIDLFNPPVITDDFGNKFARFSKFYWAKETIGNEEYIWVCKVKLRNIYHLPRAFQDYGTNWTYVDIGCYEASNETVGGTTYLCSKSEKYPQTTTTRTNFYNYAKNNNTRSGLTENAKYLITTMSEWNEIIMPLMMIVYGTRNTQNIYNGVISLDTASYSVAAYDKTTKTIYFATDKRSSYKVGNCFALNGSSSLSQYRTITENGTVVGSISNNVFTPSTSGTTYYYIKTDGDLIDNLTTVQIRPNPTGFTDSIKSESGTSTNDGKGSFKFMNIENIYGNTWTNILDCTVKDNKSYVCMDLNNWSDVDPTTNSSFEAVSYTNASSDGYAKTMGWDSNHPDVQITTEIGGSSATYYSDYYYQNPGVRTTFAGGDLGSGSDAGLFYWGLVVGLGGAGWAVGGRLSRRILVGG